MISFLASLLLDKIEVKSLKHGKNILKPEVTNISKHGFWVLINNKEYFLPFDKFPWFKEANIEQISNVVLLHGFHLYWPKLDIDLSFDIIENPEKFKLIAKGK